MLIAHVMDDLNGYIFYIWTTDIFHDRIAINLPYTIYVQLTSLATVMEQIFLQSPSTDTIREYKLHGMHAIYIKHTHEQRNRKKTRKHIIDCIIYVHVHRYVIFTFKVRSKSGYYNIHV